MNLSILSHYHAMPHFDALKIYSPGKHARKEEIACNKQFLLFSQRFLPYMAFFFISFKMHSKMSSAICFDLDQSKTLSSGNRLYNLEF